MHDGIEIEPTISNTYQQPVLAKDIYIQHQIEDIKVEVLNGCGVTALAAKATEFLRDKKIDVISSDNADNHNYEKTLIIQRNEKFNSLKKVVEALVFILLIVPEFRLYQMSRLVLMLPLFLVKTTPHSQN